MAKRKAISDKMKWQCLLYRQPAVCPICFGSIGPLSNIQWDHVWEVADDGPHDYQNLRPIHIECHKKKSAKAETQRSRIDRLEKELHGLPKRKRVKRPMKSRGFDKKKRAFPSRPLRKTSSELTLRKPSSELT